MEGTKITKVVSVAGGYNHENTKYVKQEPYVGEDGIYEPVNVYVPEGQASTYRMLMSKELFIEAYNKYIKGKTE